MNFKGKAENISIKRGEYYRKYTNLIFLKIFVILPVNKKGVPLPLKVEH
jgi:hypothetical protein